MTQTVTHRIANFSAGPAVLPVEVLEEARENMLSLGDTGIGICEHSHRGKAFDAVIKGAEAAIRRLAGLDDEWAVLFLQGGASSQFFMVPMNFLGGATADYVDTGSWASKAIKEAKLFGTPHVAASTKADNYTHLPREFAWSDGAVYSHITSNNTIFGTEYHFEPASPAPLVVDASSNIFSKPIDFSNTALLYAGAQKNLGPSGVTLVLVRRDFLARAKTDGIPTMLRYSTHVDEGSLYNTPPTFGIFILGLVLKWIEGRGGLSAMAELNRAKAALLYDMLDASDFWRTPVAKADRSLMNVVFNLPTPELEAQLIAEAGKAGFSGIKGHRSVGGVRASIYNAFPVEHLESFVSFLREYERTHG
jgi:phosphoserine aminotransferase